MNDLNKKIDRLLEELEKKKITREDLIKKFTEIYYEDIGFAKIDHHRTLRRDFPEVVYGANKTPGQICSIAKSILKYSSVLLVTRTTKEVFDILSKQIGDLVFDEQAGLIYTDTCKREKKLRKGIVVICAGTSDIPVAQEAAVTAQLMGNDVERIYDIGVAGIHRLLSFENRLRSAKVIIAVAGMEGALPSVVSSITQAIVIAVPTSIGYGASFKGLAPLLTMLNSCSPGIVIVNIDNGFGAGYAAGIINNGR